MQIFSCMRSIYRLLIAPCFSRSTEVDILGDEGESITNGGSGAPVMSQLLGAAEKRLPENITQNRYPPYLG
jgi:hypothetical protein